MLDQYVYGTVSTAKCPCTNAIIILGKMYIPFIDHLLEELQTRLLIAVTDLKLIICFQLKPII